MATRSLLARCWLTLLLAAPAVALAQPDDLSVEQAQLQEKYSRLEALAVRIAELVERENPDRAEQLRGAIAKSRDLALSDRFEAIVALLEKERYAAAQRDQNQLSDSLETLLGLLLADPREARLEAERKLLRQAIKDVGRLIREQSALRNETIDREDPSESVDKQDALAEQTEGVESSLGESPAGGSGQPGADPQGGAEPQQQPPSQDAQPDQDQSGKRTPRRQAAQRLAEAKSAMERASGRMGERDGQGAADAQTEAQRQLEEAREELEEALRQTREEEVMRTLTRLAARLRGILAEQTEINRLTAEVQELHGDKPSPQKRSAAAGLSKREDEAIAIADGALRLLEAEGSSVAFVEVLEQAREDMRAVSGRLMSSDTAALTQSIEQDIVDALGDAIAALDAQLGEMANRQQQSGQQEPGAGGQSSESRLVEQIAELRMIRSLQKRILARTQRTGLMADQGELGAAELRQALDELSYRQRRAIDASQRLMTE